MKVFEQVKNAFKRTFKPRAGWMDVTKKKPIQVEEPLVVKAALSGGSILVDTLNNGQGTDIYREGDIVFLKFLHPWQTYSGQGKFT